MVFALPKSLAVWGTPDFPQALQLELLALPTGILPLQQGLSHSSYVADSPFQIMVLATVASNSHYYIRVGVFYQGIVAGCHCADDPSPVEPQHEYCELALTVDRIDGQATVTIVS